MSLEPKDWARLIENGQTELKILRKGHVKQNKILDEDLWFLYLDSKAIGPFHTPNLKEFIFSHNDFSSKTLVLNAKVKKWNCLYEYKEFDRRTLENVSKEKSAELRFGEKYFVLLDGQKIGPFSPEDIKKKIEAKEFLYTTLISSDEGKSWVKIHECDGLDRRDIAGPKELPFIPKKLAFVHSDEEVKADLMAAKEEAVSSENTETMIVGLAYKETQSKIEKEIERSTQKLEEKAIIEQIRPKRSLLMGSLFSLLVIFTFATLLFSKKSPQKLLHSKKVSSLINPNSLSNGKNEENTDTVKPMKAPKEWLENYNKARGQKQNDTASTDSNKLKRPTAQTSRRNANSSRDEYYDSARDQDRDVAEDSYESNQDDSYFDDEGPHKKKRSSSSQREGRNIASGFPEDSPLRRGGDDNTKALIGQDPSESSRREDDGELPLGDYEY